MKIGCAAFVGAFAIGVFAASPGAAQTDRRGGCGPAGGLGTALRTPSRDRHRGRRPPERDHPDGRRKQRRARLPRSDPARGRRLRGGEARPLRLRSRPGRAVGRAHGDEGRCPLRHRRRAFGGLPGAHAPCHDRGQGNGVRSDGAAEPDGRRSRRTWSGRRVPAGRAAHLPGADGAGRYCDRHRHQPARPAQRRRAVARCGSAAVGARRRHDHAGLGACRPGSQPNLGGSGRGRPDSIAAFALSRGRDRPRPARGRRASPSCGYTSAPRRRAGGRRPAGESAR